MLSNRHLYDKKKLQIEFIEKNCLRHGEFKLNDLFPEKSELFFDLENVQTELKQISFCKDQVLLCLGLE